MLKRLERQVPLPTFDAAHVRTMHAHDVGERLLAEAALLPDTSKVPSEGSLQVAIHDFYDFSWMLLVSLQTYE